MADTVFRLFLCGRTFWSALRLPVIMFLEVRGLKIWSNGNRPLRVLRRKNVFPSAQVVAASQASTRGMTTSNLEKQDASHAVKRDRGVRSEHMHSQCFQRHFSVLPFLDL